MDALNSHVWSIIAHGVVVNISTPKTVIQYAVSATHDSLIVGFKASQSASVTSAQEKVRLARIAAGNFGTGMTVGAVGTNVLRWGSPDDAFKGQLGAALTGTGVGVTPVEPTYGDVPTWRNFNVLNGDEIWFPRPLFVPVAAGFGLQFQGIVAGTWDVELYVKESG